MKSFFSVVLVIVTFTLSACAQDHLVSYNELPENAK